MNEGSLDEARKLLVPELLEQSRCNPQEVVRYAPDKGKAPLRVRFDGRRSHGPCGRVVSWVWDFDDGEWASGSTVSHVFRRPGTYEVRLTLKDARGFQTLMPMLHYVVVTE